MFDLAVFASPMIVIQFIEIAWRVYLPGYFAMTTGLSLSAIGALLLAMRLFDSVIDPAIAWASDRFPTYDLAQARYRAGSVALLDTFVALQTLIEARAALASSQQQLSSARIDLFKALGGGWM